LLDVAPRRAGGLVADEQDVVPRVAQHGFQVIDDAPAAAHAAGGNDDGRAGGAGEVIDRLQVGGMVADGEHLVEGQRVAPGRQLAPSPPIPVFAQFL
jgi:hypothetical protein